MKANTVRCRVCDDSRLDPEVELHPSTAAERNIGAGDWVRIETPQGSVRARARLNDTLAPGVVCGQHGWWQACQEIGAPGYDPFSPDGANLNIIIGNEAIDPVSGSVPHRRLSLSNRTRRLALVNGPPRYLGCVPAST